MEVLRRHAKKLPPPARDDTPIFHGPNDLIDCLTFRLRVHIRAGEQAFDLGLKPYGVFHDGI
jgi:hypothetical protein